jgi:adenine phosphoribosyltransferase
MTNDLKALITDYPDFPKPGVVFRDISPLLADPTAFRSVIVAMVAEVKRVGVDCLVAIESRGFLFAAPVAFEAGLPLVLVRKAGKLPGDLVQMEYALEYGSAVLELKTDGIASGHRVAVVDDVLATGGTAAAAAELCRRSGGTVALHLFLIELVGLAGRMRLGSGEVFSLVSY